MNDHLREQMRETRVFKVLATVLDSEVDAEEVLVKALGRKSDEEISHRFEVYDDEVCSWFLWSRTDQGHHFWDDVCTKCYNEDFVIKEFFVEIPV